ncbi:hypothetical protein NBRC116602_28740 [Hyphomicrobiales bacterium 4NK60-0047b]
MSTRNSKEEMREVYTSNSNDANIRANDHYLETIEKVNAEENARLKQKREQERREQQRQKKLKQEQKKAEQKMRKQQQTSSSDEELDGKIAAGAFILFGLITLANTENWVAGLVVGVIAAIIAYKYWQQIVVIGVIVGIVGIIGISNSKASQPDTLKENHIISATEK